MKRFIVVLVFLTAHFLSHAQDPVAVFNNYHDNLPAEHIYVHVDKQSYVPGETIWFKAYLYTPGVANRLSTNLYVELLNEKGDIVESVKLPVLEGKPIINQFEIPRDANRGVFTLRAWTNYTPQKDASYAFRKAVVVLNGSAAIATDTQNKTGYHFEWFPEGGTLVSGVDNTIAFRCTDARMQPAVVSGTLLNQKGDDLGSFSANQYGLGYFNYSPANGVKYFADLHFPDKTTKRIELPAAGTEGVALSVADNGNGKDFTIFTSPHASNVINEIVLLAVMDNEIILQQKLPVRENLAEGTISSDKLREGILHFLVFDKENKLLAQRRSFVTNKSRHIPIELKTQTLDLKPKGLNNWTFVLPPGITGNFSLAITDLQNELVFTDEDDLYSTLLMQSGNSKPLSFAQVEDEEVRDLSLLTDSAKLTAANWSSFANKQLPKLDEELHLPLHGTLHEGGNNKLLTGGQLNFLVKTKDSTGRRYNVPVMEDGSFKLYGLVFEDTARIYYSWKGAKGEKAIPTTIELGRENTNYTAWLKNIPAPPQVVLKKQLAEKVEANTIAQMIKEVDEENVHIAKLTPKEAGIAQTTKPVKEPDVNKRYTSGAFTSNANAKVVNLLQEPPNNLSGNIFDYLTGRLSGVSIEKDAALSYALYSGRSNTTGEVIRNVRTATVTNPRSGTSRTPQDFTELGRVKGKFYLDEVEVTSDVIARISVDHIALVKYFPPGAIMLPGIGLSGVLAVYTKKPEDMDKDDIYYFDNIIFPGYSAPRQFYSPDYTTEDKNRVDTRRTIYWNPAIDVKENNEIRVSFYNSDKAKKLRVVLEGITSDGRPVSFQKTIE